MSEQNTPKPGRELYQFSWSTSTAKPQNETDALAEALGPEGYVEQTAPAQDNPATPEEVREDANNADGSTEESAPIAYPGIDEASLKAFRSSPKSKQKLPTAHNFSLGMIRLPAIAGWTMVAGIGGVMVAMDPGSMVRLTELGGVWACVTAAIWFLPSKLK